MSKSYGIKFCEKVISDLEKIEDNMFDEKGYGFMKSSQEDITLLKYKYYLKIFKREKDMGFEPSYKPEYHGSF